MNVGVNCQDGAIFTADAADLARFASALVICSWTPPTAALNVLASAGVPVGCWRFTERPLAWPGWPGDYVRRCPYLLVDNEPDLEGWTSWGPAVAAQWIAAGGLIVEPAWSDDRKRTPPPYAVAVVSAHVYPRGLGAANLAAVRARANGRPVWITEAGDATAPGQILVELAALGAADVPTWLYTFRALDQAAQPAYNLAGVALTPPPPPSPLSTKEGHAMPAPLFQFTQDAGSSDCWCECIRSFFLRYGYPLDLDLVFQAGKGYPRPAGGEPATFATVKRAITTIAQQLGVKVQMADFDAPNVVAAALHDPDAANPWTIIAGVAESVLQPGQNYGHFILLDHEDANGMVKVVDSYTNVDGDATEYYPFAQVAQAMVSNWEPQIDACGFKIVA